MYICIHMILRVYVPPLSRKRRKLDTYIYTHIYLNIYMYIYIHIFIYDTDSTPAYACTKYTCCASQGRGSLLGSPGRIFSACLFPPLGLISFQSNIQRCRRSAAPEVVMPKEHQPRNAVVVTCICTAPVLQSTHYGVAIMSRLLKIIRLFCKRAL